MDLIHELGKVQNINLENTENKAKTFKIIATVETLRQTLASCELCAALKFLSNLNVGT